MQGTDVRDFEQDARLEGQLGVVEDWDALFTHFITTITIAQWLKRRREALHVEEIHEYVERRSF